MTDTRSYEDYIEEIDEKAEDLVQTVAAYMTDFDESYVREHILKAYEYAKEAHKWVYRHSGYPYINHPVEATKILITLQPDIPTIQACLMHDVIEDTDRTEQDVKDEFWDDVAFLCIGMEKLSKVKYRWEDRAVGSLRKMFVAMAEDIRVILIKLSDRQHNMETLWHHPKRDKIERIALETLNIYAPIAARLGLFNLKNALEEECFKTLYPEDYKRVTEDLERLKESKQAFKENAISEIQKTISDLWIETQVDFRVKWAYSIYKKMKRKDIDDIENLYDIYGIRVIVPSVSDCYRVLWEIHRKWHTLPYRFKDYVALPKPNGYSSIHTTIIWFLKQFTKQPTEIQIRSLKMHKQAEIWVAAHFEYKEKWSKIAKDVNWVKELKELTENIGNNDLMSSLKIDIFKDRIFVFTPKGDAINLPAGSTPIDFAYYVHTELGNHISMAKVNNKVHPLDKELRNGNVVEVITDKNKKPNPLWLSFVKTLKAKNNIKSYIKEWDKDLHRDRWKDIMNRYLEKSGMPPFDKDLTVLKILDGREYSVDERFQLLEQVWNFSITPASLIRRILRAAGKRHKFKRNNSIKDVFRKKVSAESVEERNIIIWWQKDLPHKFWNCCKKKIENNIVAHINADGVFTVHSRNCKVLSKVNQDRLLSAYVEWQEDTPIYIKLKLLVANHLWILKTLSETLFSMGINLDEISTKKVSKTKTEVYLDLEIMDHDYLIVDRFIERMKINMWTDLIEHKIEKINYK